MDEPTKIEKLVELYENKPLIKGLIQLISPIAALDTILAKRVENIRAERAATLFEEFAKGEKELTEELIRSEDFLHCYFATVKAALNTRRREKIRMFARMLKSAITSCSFSNIDEYDEYLQILDELSFNEIRILATLEKFETQNPAKNGEHPTITAKRFWDKFISALEKSLAMPKNEIGATLFRLNRTGCYETLHGTYGEPGMLVAWGMTDGVGILTPKYFRLKKIIENEKSLF